MINFDKGFDKCTLQEQIEWINWCMEILGDKSIRPGPGTLLILEYVRGIGLIVEETGDRDLLRVRRPD